MTCFRADASPRAQPLYRYRQKVRPTKSNPPHLFFPNQTNGLPSLMGFGSNTQQHDKFKSVLVHSARRYGGICGRHVLETRTRNHNGELQIAEIRRSVLLVKEWAEIYRKDLMAIWETPKFKNLPGLEQQDGKVSKG